MNFSLTFTEQQLNVVLESLSQAPFRVVAPIIAEIQKQLQAQQATSVKVPSPAPGNGSDQVAAAA